MQKKKEEKQKKFKGTTFSNKLADGLNIKLVKL